MRKRKIWSIKPWFVLGIFLGSWWVLPTIVKSVSRIGIYELQAPVWNVSAKIKDLEEYWGLKNHSKKELLEAIRDLARLNASYELVFSENLALKDEVAHLENLLKLPKLPDYEYILARVARRDLASWSHTMIIQKGNKDGIRKGAAAIYKYGVAGRVKEVYENSAIVELVSSPTFRMAAHFQDDNRPITYQGSSNPGFTNPIGAIYNVPGDILLVDKEPKKLISSKLGGIFPDGLSIGLVDTIKPSVDGLFNQGHVRLNSTLHSLEEVAILLPLADTKVHEY